MSGGTAKLTGGSQGLPHIHRSCAGGNGRGLVYSEAGCPNRLRYNMLCWPRQHNLFFSNVITKLIQEIIVPNRAGLHLRASMKLYKSAQNFTSVVKLYKGSLGADLRNILELLSLGAVQGEKLKLEAEGEDAYDAIEAILNLFASCFDEEDVEAQTQSTNSEH